MNYGLPSEYDLFLTQAILQYLSLRNITEAINLFKSFIQYHPKFAKESKIKPQEACSSTSSSKTEPNEFLSFESPLINFINLLILSLKK